MSQHDSLRLRIDQHKPKNEKSKIDDRDVKIAMDKVIEYLYNRFPFDSTFKDYEIVYEKAIQNEFIINMIREQGIRKDFDLSYIDRKIVPDGGVLFLVNQKTGFKKPILITEMKHQGTNDERIKEGKTKQATGNAIERLGKNLTAIKAMMNYETVTPFVCFGWGCDFAPSNKTVLAKVSALNEFYQLNKIYVTKKDGSADCKAFSPVSMFFREEQWTVDEMYKIMIEIAESAFRAYMY